MKKKWIWIILAMCVVIGILTWCNSKTGIITYVKSNQDALTQYAEGCIERPEDHVRYRTWNTSYQNSFETVIFETSYLGFGSQSDQKGFCYSPSGEPNGLGNDLSQEPKDEGALYLGEGDNYTYVEKITDNWYWFERHW